MVKSTSDSSKPLSLPNAKMTQENRRNMVQFELQNNKVFEVPSIDDLKKAVDMSTIWYTDEDYDEIERDCEDSIERTILLFLKDQLEDNDLDETHGHDERNCIRGLESRLEETLAEQYDAFTAVRGHRIQEAVDAVLHEQDLQLSMEGTINDELLAVMYSSCAYESRFEATQAGIQDRREVLLLEEG